MREEEKLLSGAIYTPGDPELVAIKRKCHNLNLDYNRLYEHETEKRAEIIGEMLGEFGEGSFMQGPITFHYGTHTKIGKGNFINFNFTVQDDAYVTIGDENNFGPNCTIVTPCHPMLARERAKIKSSVDGTRKGYCYAKPVTIGNRCWFGANVVVCPGVTIGDECVIGAGSVVTRDIPSGTFAAGNPCRVIREITEEDSMKNHPEIEGIEVF